MGRSTRARRRTEHERPVYAVLGRGSAARISPWRNRAAAQRESEGAVVLLSAVWQNAAGGKGPCSGHIGSARTREGMSGKTGTNSPDGASVHRQSAPIATSTVGRGQAVPGPPPSRPDGPCLEG